MNILRQNVRSLLIEKARRRQKNKRTLYHAGQRPAAPKPKARWFRPDLGDEAWTRHWLDSPVKSGVFLTPNPVDIAQFHGVSGNVYAYKVPEWVIEKSGGIHRYDKGSEILIPEDVWEEAGNEIEFIGKTMSQQELWNKVDRSLHMSRRRQSNPQKPGWMSTEDWKQDQATEARGNHLLGLRATKHLENAVKMMTPTERAAALEAFEQDKPRRGSNWPDWVRSPLDDWDRPRTEKDQEIIALLKKYTNESALRRYVRLLVEQAEAQEVTFDKYGRPEPTTADFAFMKEYESLSKVDHTGSRGDRYWYMGEIDSKHCLVITHIRLDQHRGGIYFNSIQTVPPDVCEGQGFASKVMNKVTGLADKHGVNLRLQASAFGQKSVSDEELISWYKRAGFEQTDPDYSEILTRQPQ